MLEKQDLELLDQWFEDKKLDIVRMVFYELERSLCGLGLYQEEGEENFSIFREGICEILQDGTRDSYTGADLEFDVSEGNPYYGEKTKRKLYYDYLKEHNKSVYYYKEEKSNG